MRELAVVATAVAILVGLGLFMTWGDPGNRSTNTARTLFVLLVLVGGVVGLLVWSASSARRDG